MKKSNLLSKNLLTGKTILLISPEFWGINFNSKHHYAVNLASRKNKVYFINPPTKNNNLEKIHKNLWLINYKPLLGGLRFMPEYFSGIFVDQEIKMLEKRYKIKFDIIWNFDSSRFFNLSRINKTIKIAHIVDWSENFERGLLCKTSDINLCTSSFLEKEMKKYNFLSYNIGHGYNPSDYKISSSEKKLLYSKYNIKVGYVGNLSIQYIDWETLYKLIETNTEVGFYFIGPSEKSNLSKNPVNNKYFDDIKKLKNVICLGEIISKKIPALLSYFDILLLIYKDREFNKQLANPHKVLEYLGSGKVIVSSWIEEYKSQKGLIEMSRLNADLLNNFKNVIDNLAFLNSEKNKEARKRIALTNTYSQKIEQINKLLQSIA